jgi:predicted RNA-binding Zn-ribbon protein involved in translation (DUF1610 family)
MSAVLMLFHLVSMRPRRLVLVEGCYRNRQCSAVSLQILAPSGATSDVRRLNDRYAKSVLLIIWRRKERSLMYCPQCGAQNIAEAKFCRLCGVGFQTLVKPAQPLPILPNYGRALRPLFMGLAFLVIVLISIFSHHGFFWWMMFPAISLLSRGMGRLMQMRTAHPYNALPRPLGTFNDNTSTEIPPTRYNNSRGRQTGELILPPSITENTTRLLDTKQANSI